MERKVIQQNKTTFVISLPKKWVDKKHIVKGDKLDIREEINESLSISRKDDYKKKFNLNLKNLEEPKYRIAKIILNNIYRRGYDEINLELKEEDKEIIKKLILEQNYIGFEIFNESKTSLSISNFTEIKKGEFDLLYNKIIIMTKEILKNPIAKNLDYIETCEKYSNFLRRIIMKENKDYEYDKIILNLILILHAFKKIIKKEINISPMLLEKISNLFSLTFEKLPNKKTTLDIIQNEYFDLENLLNNSNSNMYVWEIIRYCSLCSTYIISLNFFDIKS